MHLKNYIAENLQQTTDEQIEQLVDIWDCKQLPKGHLLLSEGSLSKKVFYVEKGLLRLFYLKDGKDITHHFFTEGHIYTPIENVFFKKNYPYRLELLEDSVIRIVEYDVMSQQLNNNPQLQNLALYVTANAVKQLAERLYSIQFQTAQERYKLLLEHHPDILLRVPLMHIASFLGITQQTLSVIRAEK